MLKISLLFKKFANFTENKKINYENNSRIARIKNAKFSGYCFYRNTNVLGDFQICISVPLIKQLKISTDELFYQFANAKIGTWEFEDKILGIVSKSFDNTIYGMKMT